MKTRALARSIRVGDRTRPRHATSLGPAPRPRSHSRVGVAGAWPGPLTTATNGLPDDSTLPDGHPACDLHTPHDARSVQVCSALMDSSSFSRKGTCKTFVTASVTAVSDSGGGVNKSIPSVNKGTPIVLWAMWHASMSHVVAGTRGNHQERRGMCGYTGSEQSCPTYGCN